MSTRGPVLPRWFRFDGREPEAHFSGRGLESLCVRSFVAEAGQSAIDAFDLAQPALGRGPAFAIFEIGFELVEAGQHCRVDVELATAQAGVLMLATGAVWPRAGAEFDFAYVEVFFELSPFGFWGGLYSS
ncbi:hypothetical protein [Nocardia amikacinitolerans]|uniref:hypothetical protein n=1 Tax=Nocardia amikacinitolerans TaxID=756689 RepID=UPI0020A3BEA6|nr:hypothetical protein [Nocardia amikacinitolerans]